MPEPISLEPSPAVALLDQPYTVTTAQQEQFREDGFIKLANVFDATWHEFVASQSVSQAFNCVAHDAIPLKPVRMGKNAN